MKLKFQIFVFFLLSLLTAIFCYYLVLVNDIENFDSGIFAKIIVIINLYAIWSLGMFFKVNKRKDFSVLGLVKGYFLYLKSNYYLVIAILGNILLIFIVRNYNWFDEIDLLLFIFLNFIISQNILFMIYCFSITRDYFFINKTVWIVFIISLSLFHMDLIFDLPIITILNPLSGWFFFLTESKELNYFTSLNLVFLLFLVNFYFFKRSPLKIPNSKI